MKDDPIPEPVLKKYIVTYIAVVYATDEDEACQNMLDSDDTETSAEEDGDEPSASTTADEYEDDGFEPPEEFFYDEFFDSLDDL